MLLILLLGVTSSVWSQTYISRTTKPFNDIANSTYLTQSNRVSYDKAYEYLSGLNYRPFDKAAFAGEYFLYNNMLVQVVTITQKDAVYFKPLTKVQKWCRMMASGGEDEPIESYFTDFIKNYTNHKVYVEYFNKVGNSIHFVINVPLKLNK